VSELIPFPAERVRSESVDHIVDLHDQNLRQAAIAILDEAFATGGPAVVAILTARHPAVVAILTARLFVSIDATYGDSTLLEALEEMARNK
jgi:hypothetical protein